MCLGIAGQVVSCDSHPYLADVNVQGKIQAVNLGLLDDVQPGEWILIHLGFALERMTEAEAIASMQLLSDLGEGGELSP